MRKFGNIVGGVFGLKWRTANGNYLSVFCIATFVGFCGLIGGFYAASNNIPS